MLVFTIINLIFGGLFAVCYFYQFIYIFITIFKKDKPLPDAEPHSFGVLIAARNESAVIGQLIDSLHGQNYPADKIKIFVVADNCTDNTSEICRNKGCTVWERFNGEKIGKGYALDFLLKKIFSEGLDKGIDGFMVFDADNVVDVNFCTEMNKVYSSGFKVVTSYRNSKNYGDNWISAGYALWYLRESKYLNCARMKLGTSCAVSGTGFLFDRSFVEKDNGWNYHLLTEDIEFSADVIVSGERIAYADKAYVYDEQPTKFSTSWRQRMRWVRGFFQVVHRYGGRLLAGSVKRRSFACYDMLMNIAPAIIFTILGAVVNLVGLIYGIVTHQLWFDIFAPFILNFIQMYAAAVILGVITNITEKDKIFCTRGKKVLYIFTFPIFMMTYIPITICAMFKKVWWQPIEHNVSKNLDEIKNSGREAEENAETD